MNRQELLRQLPLRLTAGAFMLNSGFGKVDADKSAAEQPHGFASGTYPMLGKVEPERFATAAVAGVGLTAFSAGLIGMYLRTPGMRKQGSLRPTEQGIALAKDVWLLGIGLSLTFVGLDGKGGRR